MVETTRRVVPHFQREELAAVRSARLQLLLIEHWNEVAYYKDIPLEVDWLKYEKIDEANKLRIYTARHEHQLIGYACYVVDFHGHYASCYQAIQDVLFLTPEYRHARIGSQLVAFADTMMRAEGVRLVAQHSKLAHPIDAVLKRQRYSPVETIWMKRLDQEQ
ncbi:MAG TPA: GNAT family N-acetyltransferase [Steroidobacteraceae bacterium]|jgi:GNAT superfamily N-acetyltransferase